MHTTSRRLRLHVLVLGALGLGIVASAPRAAERVNASEIRARYQQERAACLSGASHQDRRTCLQEAAAARDEALRGRLYLGGQYEQNALQRCQALPATEREACRARVQGAGTVSGSVEGGGLYREYTVIEPAARDAGGQPPASQQPGMQQPGMQQPGMQQPGMQQPGMQQPGMQQPGMQQPGMQQPGMQQPGMQPGPSSGQPMPQTQPLQPSPQPRQ